ncbi:unnamed protein product [Coregonus sp. 'balchen']|nr:unnamed protein product [Coregonus sp. 'balchen']
MERRRRWGGRLADSPDDPMLRNKGWGVEGDRGCHLFTRPLEHYICYSLLLPLLEVPPAVIRSVPPFKLPVSGRLAHSPLLQVEMAHRLLVRRIWTLSVKDFRCLPASTSSFSTSLRSSTAPLPFLSPKRTLFRSLPHTSRREVSFNVQDHEDFTERVINSELPVLIDFHAQ